MLTENEFADNQDDSQQSTENNQQKPIREGQPMGGKNFGKNNNTPAGDDKNNPSQNAGYTNEYFRRTEPSEEHPEDTNFKVKEQEGAPDYSSAQPNSSSPQNQQVNSPSEQQSYQEGTADNDGNNPENVPGPNKLTDQKELARMMPAGMFYKTAKS